jgi:hypothetical protein
MSEINNSTGGVGCIYSLVPISDRSPVWIEKYIGSTTQTLAERLRLHKSDYRRYLDGKHNFVSSFELFDKYGVDGVIIVPIEIYYFDDLNDLRRREGEYIKSFECLNKVVAGRTIKEYYQDNKEALIEYQRKYYEDNKEALIEYQREYHDANRDQRLIKMKEYREANHDQINTKIICECGCEIIKRTLSRHQKTEKHISLMNAKQ